MIHSMIMNSKLFSKIEFFLIVKI